MGLMLVEAPGLLRANGVNERVSATEWPLDHPFNCLTNSMPPPLNCTETPGAREKEREAGERRGGEGDA